MITSNQLFADAEQEGSCLINFHKSFHFRRRFNTFGSGADDDSRSSHVKRVNIAPAVSSFTSWNHSKVTVRETIKPREEEETEEEPRNVSPRKKGGEIKEA